MPNLQRHSSTHAIYATRIPLLKYDKLYNLLYNLLYPLDGPPIPSNGLPHRLPCWSLPSLSPCRACFAVAQGVYAAAGDEDEENEERGVAKEEVKVVVVEVAVFTRENRRGSAKHAIRATPTRSSHGAMRA